MLLQALDRQQLGLNVWRNPWIERVFRHRVNLAAKSALKKSLHLRQAEESWTRIRREPDQHINI